LQGARDQNSLILDGTKDYRNLLDSIPDGDAAVLDLHFGATGPSRFDIDEVGPNGEKLTGTANGHRIEVDDHDKDVKFVDKKDKPVAEPSKEIEKPPTVPTVTPSSS
jgi:hypothetical protein